MEISGSATHSTTKVDATTSTAATGATQTIVPSATELGSENRTLSAAGNQDASMAHGPQATPNVSFGGLSASNLTETNTSYEPPGESRSKRINNGTVERTRQRKRPRSAVVTISERELGNAWPSIKAILLKAIDGIQRRDIHRIFAEPVDPVAVPAYLDIIKEPMDLGTIRQRIESAAYTSFSQVLHDCDLVWRNCFQFNPPDSIFYQAGKACKQEARKAWKNARERLLRLRNEPTLREAVERFLRSHPRQSRPRAHAKSDASSLNESQQAPVGSNERQLTGDAAVSSYTQRASVVPERSDTSTWPSTVRFRASCLPSEDSSPGESSAEQPRRTAASTAPVPADREHSTTGQPSMLAIRISLLEQGSVTVASRNIASQSDGGNQTNLTRSEASAVNDVQGTEAGAGGPRYAKNESSSGSGGARQPLWLELVQQQHRWWPSLLSRISSSYLHLQEVMAKEWLRQRYSRSAALKDTNTGLVAGPAPRPAVSFRHLLSQISRKRPGWSLRERPLTSITTAPFTVRPTDQATKESSRSQCPHEEHLHGDSVGAASLYRANPCRPLQGRTFLALDAYANSLRRYVTDAGLMAHRIVDELLSPEKEHERLLQQWKNDVLAWERKLEDEQEARLAQFERCYGAFRAKVQQLQHDGLDLDWLLDTVLDPELAEQVEAVPLDSLREDLPYGVAAAELRALRDYLWERTNTRGKRIPYLESMIQVTEQASTAGAAALPRRLVAAAMDGSYEETLARAMPGKVAPAGAITTTSTSSAQALVHSRPLHPLTAAMQRPLDGLGRVAAPASTGRTAIPRTSASAGNLKVAVSSALKGMRPSSSATWVKSATPEMPLSCANCGTTETPGWRQGENKEQRLCNACGLFWVKYKRQRPPNLWRHTSRVQKNSQGAGGASGDPLNAPGRPNASSSMS
jgi:hypothetical protein